MKANPIPIVLALLLPFLVSFAPANLQLVLIEKDTAEHFELLEDFPAEPHFRGEEWLLAVVSARDIESIRRIGFRVRVVDSDPWSEPYFLVRLSPYEGIPRLPTSFREIAWVSEGMIVKGPQEKMDVLKALGHPVVRIHKSIIPLAGKETPQFRGLSPVWNATEHSVTDQVSDSTITEYLTRLVDFQTRLSCTDSCDAAAEYIYDLFLDFGFAEVYYDSFPVEGFPCDVQRNVVAVKPGTIYPDRFILVGGHYDSWVLPTEPCDGDSFAPGADDNGSGAVAAIEAARVLVDEVTDMSLIFIALGAEEQGHWGSTHFAEEAYATGMDIYVMINMDMIAYMYDEEWDIEIRTPAASYPFYLAMEAMALTNTDLIPFHSYGVVADDLPFFQNGFSTVGIVEGDGWSPHLHRCTDLVENLSIPFLTEVAEMVTLTTLYLAVTPIAPVNFQVANVGEGTSLHLEWDPNEEPDLAGYRIYWGMESGIYDSVRTVTATVDTLRDLTEGTTYYVAVSAFDTDENESFLTPEIGITASSVPAVPVGITSTSLQTEIVVEWAPNQQDLDLAGYNLYRWEVGGAPDTVQQAFIPAPTSIYMDDGVDTHILYGYHVTAVDTDVPANESAPSEAVLGRLATHDMGILVVDDTSDGPGGPFMPTDEEVDAFYSDLLRDYRVEATWDHGDSAAADRYLMDYDAGIYSTILWHTDVRDVQHVDSDTTTLRKFLDTGGNLWMTGWQVLAQLTGESDPYIQFFGDGFFANIVGVDSARTTSTADQDFIGAESVVGGFPSVAFDSAMVHPIGGLYNTEVLLPPFDGAYSIYTYISSDGPASEYHGLPVGVASSLTDHGLVLTDFPLYFLERGDAQALAAAVMDLFEEPVGVGDEQTAGLPRAFSLSQNYPNPFNPSTTIGFNLPVISGSNQLVNLTVYDLRGRCIRKLVNSDYEPGRHKIHWDGRNDQGESVSSGIYLYQLKAGGEMFTRKMTVLK
jgi:hypothetical protein